RHGKMIVKGGEEYNSEGRALLWFVTQWLPSRAPYRFALPRELTEWLNTTHLDLTERVTERPSISGPVQCTALKPVSRFMQSIAEQSGRGSLDSFEEYYDFLAWYAFSFMCERNVPGILLPTGVVELLNAPAAGKDVPLTVGMWLYLKA